MSVIIGPGGTVLLGPGGTVADDTDCCCGGGPCDCCAIASIDITQTVSATIICDGTVLSMSGTRTWPTITSGDLSGGGCSNSGSFFDWCVDGCTQPDPPDGNTINGVKEYSYASFMRSRYGPLEFHDCGRIWVRIPNARSM